MAERTVRVRGAGTDQHSDSRDSRGTGVTGEHRDTRGTGKYSATGVQHPRADERERGDGQSPKPGTDADRRRERPSGDAASGRGLNAKYYRSAFETRDKDL